MPVVRVVCIGCGPTVIGATHHIHKLIKSGELNPEEVQVTVLERFDNAGGLAGTEIDDKGFAWDLGGHVRGEPSKYECFNEALRSLPCEWNLIRRAAKCDMSPIYGDKNELAEEGEDHSTYVPYPVQLSVPLFPPDVRDACIQGIIEAHAVEYDEKPKNYDEWTTRVFGEKLKDIFITPYNRKVWTVNLEEMNANWVGERVAVIDVDKLDELSKKSRQQLLKDDLGWGPNTFFRYPKNGRGCSATWQLMVKDHPQQWYKYKHEVTGVDADNKTVTAVHDGKECTFQFDHLLSSMPITLLCDMIKIERPFVRHSKVALVGIGVNKPQSVWAQNVTWAYFHAKDIIFYRCTFLSNYNDVMTPDHSKYWSLLLEVGFQPDVPVDRDHIVEQCVQGLIKAQVIDDADSVCQRWYRMLPYGYPIPTVPRDDELVKAHAQLEAANIYSRGRFGGWKYEVANMDHSFAQGWEVADRIFYGKPETVYVTGL